MALCDPRPRGPQFSVPEPSPATPSTSHGSWPSPEQQLAASARAVLEAAFGHRPVRQLLTSAHPGTLAIIKRYGQDRRELTLRSMTAQVHQTYAEVAVTVSADVGIDVWTMRWEKYEARWHCVHLAPLSSLQRRSARSYRLRP